MSDSVLTEKRFLELLDEVLDRKLEEKLEAKLEEKLEAKLDKKFEEKLAPIYATLKKLEGFQNHEAEGIEVELQMILNKYLQNQYPHMTITRFPMKTLSDPYTDQLITNLDAAFLLTPYKHKPNYRRLEAVGIKTNKLHNDVIMSSIFVLAEAKHFINKNKISEKLGQFERIIQLFLLSKSISKGDIPSDISKSFINTVKRNSYISEIDEYYLFFGAAYWEKDLLITFTEDISKYDNMVYNFNKMTDISKKVALYDKIRTLEKKWYIPILNDLDTDAIIKTSNYISPMNYVRVIQPSGDRYSVLSPKEPVGISTLSLHGGKTRKLKN